MLAIVLPVIPIHPFFGPISSALCVIALLVVGLGGRAAATRKSESENPVPTAMPMHG